MSNSLNSFEKYYERNKKGVWKSFLTVIPVSKSQPMFPGVHFGFQL